MLKRTKHELDSNSLEVSHFSLYIISCSSLYHEKKMWWKIANFQNKLRCFFVLTCLIDDFIGRLNAVKELNEIEMKEVLVARGPPLPLPRVQESVSNANNFSGLIDKRFQRLGRLNVARDRHWLFRDNDQAMKIRRFEITRLFDKLTVLILRISSNDILE